MSSEELIRQLRADGWLRQRQSGSNVTLSKPGVIKIITVPYPRKDLSKGIIRQAQEISGLKLF